MMKKINIAIDGPSAAGKSTIAKRLGAKLGYVHLDTGAMYRCTALKCVREGISLSDEQAVCDMLKNTKIELTPEGGVFMDGEDVSTAIRTDEISLAASKVSAHKNVRSDLVARQQEMAKAKGFIMDGRDIGTVVLKDAEIKIFMTASQERVRKEDTSRISRRACRLRTWKPLPKKSASVIMMTRTVRIHRCAKRMMRLKSIHPI